MAMKRSVYLVFAAMVAILLVASEIGYAAPPSNAHGVSPTAIKAAAGTAENFGGTSNIAASSTTNADGRCTHGAEGYTCLPDGHAQITYTDPSGLCTWPMTVTWGDGSTDTKTLSAGGSVTFVHDYDVSVGRLFTANVSWPAGTSSDPEQGTCNSGSAQYKYEVPNQPPTADFTWSTDADNPLLVRFDASAKDPEGEPLVDYAWSFGDNFSGRGKTTSHPYSSVGTYNVTLSVVDSLGQTTRVTKTIELKNHPPTASFTGSSGGKNSGVINFDASASSDPERDTLTYSWNFGDGSTGSGVTTSHRYTKAGQYTVTLSVDDGHGGTDSKSGLITITKDTGGGGGGGTGGGGGVKYNVQLGPPLIHDVRVQDTDSNQRVSARDLFRFVFTESMDEKSTPAKGSSFQIRDADGTIMELTCGTYASCEMAKGVGTVAGISVKNYQVMLVLLLKPPPQSSMLAPGTTPGLQYPATIVKVSDDFKDRTGTALDLPGSRDIEIEAGSIVDDI
jgi:PKD repeat protein